MGHPWVLRTPRNGLFENVFIRLGNVFATLEWGNTKILRCDFAMGQCLVY